MFEQYSMNMIESFRLYPSHHGTVVTKVIEATLAVDLECFEMGCVNLN